MTSAKDRRDGIYLFVLGSLLFVFAGVAVERLNYSGMIDFREYYFGARCLIEHHDPYKQSDLSAIYEREGGNLPSEPCPGCWHRSTDHLTPNFPTIFLLVAPLDFNMVHPLAECPGTVQSPRNRKAMPHQDD